MWLPFSSQLSLAARAATWARLTIGTAAKSKLSRVLPGRQPGFGEMAGDAAARALGELVLDQRGEEAGGRPASRSAVCGEVRPSRAMVGRRSSASISASRAASMAAAVDGLAVMSRPRQAA